MKVKISCCIGHTGALESLVDESVHAPAGLYKIKGDASSANSNEKKISDVVSNVEVNPRTGNVESDHQGRVSLSKNEWEKKAMEPG